MKLLLLSLSFFITAFNFTIKAQTNLVVNPSFEIHTACPSSAGQVNYATGWDTCRATADYFNSCATTTFFQVPQNALGNQLGAQGNAYCGLFTFDFNGFYREILIGQLSIPLVVSQKYYLSFKINRAGNNGIAGCSTNKMGAKFSKVKMNNVAINNTAHYYSNTIVTDTINWTALFGSFIADSTYQYIMLGNFFDDINTNLIIGGSGQSAYYFIDDVCVSADSIFTANYTTDLEETTEDKKFEIYPNPAHDYLSINSSDILLEIKLYNTLGALMFIERNIGKAELVIDLSFIPKGIYSVAIKTKSTDSIKRIIIN